MPGLFTPKKSTMEFKQQQLFENIPFEDYLKMPGYSYSYLKGSKNLPDSPTENMLLGTAVHNYLLEPHKFDHTSANAKAIAMALKPMIAPVLPHAKSELSVTGLMLYEGFSMPYKGRVDIAIPGKLVIDIKVTTIDIRKAIDFFGYHHQVSGYAYAIGATKAFIVAINSRTKKTQVVAIHITPDFWQKKIIQNGFPVTF